MKAENNAESVILVDHRMKFCAASVPRVQGNSVEVDELHGRASVWAKVLAGRDDGTEIAAPLAIEPPNQVLGAMHPVQWTHFMLGGLKVSFARRSFSLEPSARHTVFFFFSGIGSYGSQMCVVAPTCPLCKVRAQEDRCKRWLGPLRGIQSCVRVPGEGQLGRPPAALSAPLDEATLVIINDKSTSHEIFVIMHGKTKVVHCLHVDLRYAWTQPMLVHLHDVLSRSIGPDPVLNDSMTAATSEKGPQRGATTRSNMTVPVHHP